MPVQVQRVALRTPTLPPATHTNCYLVGEHDFVVVEPASGDTEEVRTLHAAVEARLRLGHRLRAAMVTHHHGDHMGGAEHLRQAFGVPLLAHPVTRRKLQGVLTVDQVLNDGDELPGLSGLRVLHTPGHAPGHLCVWSQEDGWMIAGDMVASVGTILIDPSDDGDMTAYLDQLGRMASLGPSRLYPAHGEPMDGATEHLARYIHHRLMREMKVLDAVGPREVSALETVVARAYADTPTYLWPLAERSAQAHLDRLATLGRVVRELHGWRRTVG